MVVAALRIGAQELTHRLGLGGGEELFATLAVGARLRRQLRRLGQVELTVEDRVARRVLVDVGGAVTDPLPGDEDRELDVELDLAHLKRRTVAVAHQVADEPTVVAQLGGAAPVRHPRRLHDGTVVAHVVNDADEAVIEHRGRLEQHLFEGRHRRPASSITDRLRVAYRAQLVLFQRHGGGPFTNGKAV